jgi:hypothetical protein
MSQAHYTNPEGGEFLIVQVPENTNGIDIQTWDGDQFLNFYGFEDIKLPKGSWQIHAVTDSIDNKRLHDIVEFSSYWDDMMGLTRYYRSYPDLLEDSCLDTAKESFQSLLRSLGFDTNNKQLILIENGKA